MAEMTRVCVLKVLRRANPSSKEAALCVYADAFMDYVEAERNIRAHGNIVLHPRTGAPIENPYLRVRAGALKTLHGKNFVWLKTDGLWRPLNRGARNG